MVRIPKPAALIVPITPVTSISEHDDGGPSRIPRRDHCVCFIVRRVDDIRASIDDGHRDEHDGIQCRVPTVRQNCTSLLDILAGGVFCLPASDDVVERQSSKATRTRHHRHTPRKVCLRVLLDEVEQRATNLHMVEHARYAHGGARTHASCVRKELVPYLHILPSRICDRADPQHILPFLLACEHSVDHAVPVHLGRDRDDHSRHVVEQRSTNTLLLLRNIVSASLCICMGGKEYEGSRISERHARMSSKDRAARARGAGASAAVLAAAALPHERASIAHPSNPSRRMFSLRMRRVTHKRRSSGEHASARARGAAEHAAGGDEAERGGAVASPLGSGTLTGLGTAR